MKIKKALGIFIGLLFMNGQAVLANENQTESTVNKNVTEETTTVAKPEKDEVTTKETVLKKKEEAPNKEKEVKRTGWMKDSNGIWYYYNQNGVLETSKWIGDYYLEHNGQMATNKWVDDYRYFVDSSGKWIPGKIKKNGWKKEDGYWYYYDVQENLTRNKWVDSYYYLGSDGKMSVDNWVDNYQYYVDKDGVWVPGKKKENWIRLDSIWYFYENGLPVRNVWKGNYFLQEDGTMATNKWVDDYRYFVGDNGAWIRDKKMKSGWVKENGYWYFYEGKESLVKNAWRGNYYLGETGEMLVNQWVDQNRYYVNEDGKWIPEAQKGKDGWKQNSSGDWYHFSNGIPSRNKWVGSYYLLDDGKMATNKWVDNFKYYVGSDGAWVSNISEAKNRKEILLDLARGFIGVEQYNPLHQYLVNQYNSGPSSYSGYKVQSWDDWCDVFVSSMYQIAGMIDLIDKEAYVPYHINIFKNKRIWIGKSTPRAGDIVTFDWNGDGLADHIAIVEKVEDGKIVTIEGNTTEHLNVDESKVVRHTHRLSAYYIIGYARPNY